MLNLSWAYDQFGENLNPRTTNWNSVSAHGVYVLWVPGNVLAGPRYIRVGQGNIRDRVQAHLSDREIGRFTDLRFSFAAVSVLQRDGVERYLADQLLPLVGDRFPDARAIPVNLPQAA